MLSNSQTLHAINNPILSSKNPSFEKLQIKSADSLQVLDWMMQCLDGKGAIACWRLECTYKEKDKLSCVRVSNGIKWGFKS